MPGYSDDTANIVINGQPLTPAEVMTLRVAVTNLQGDASDPDWLGKDETGRAITAGYFAATKTILRKLIKGQTT